MVSGFRSLCDSVHHTETTGAFDTRKNSPAVRSVPCLEICVNYKRSGSLEGKMGGRHIDGDVCIDSHRRTLLQRNAASQELSALYSDNWAHCIILAMIKGRNYCKVVAFFDYYNENIAYFNAYDIYIYIYVYISSHCNRYLFTDV